MVSRLRILATAGLAVSVVVFVMPYFFNVLLGASFFWEFLSLVQIFSIVLTLAMLNRRTVVYVFSSISVFIWLVFAIHLSTYYTTFGTKLLSGFGLTLWGDGFDFESAVYRLIYLSFRTSLLVILCLFLFFAIKAPELKESKMNRNPFPQQPDYLQALNWIVRAPGLNEEATSIEALNRLAKSGSIKAKTIIIDARTNQPYPASQVPGIFSNKSYLVTCLLSWFLGVLGVDRFYLGYMGMGLGKLFTLGGLGIWGIIDFILIISKKVPDVNGDPLA